MNKFDDFLEIDGDLTENFYNLSLRCINIFLSKINARHVEDVAVKFVKRPFLDILVAFRINGQIVYYDQEYVKLKSLKAKYDAVLANMFNNYDYQKIDEICLDLSKKLEKTYKNTQGDN